MKTLRFLPLPLLLVVGLLAAGCGGSTQNVPQDAVAVVGSDTITKAQYNQLLASAQAQYKANKKTFPKVGTTAYKSLSDQAVTYLVQESELEQKAKELGVTVTAKDIDTRLNQIKQQNFGNNEKLYRQQLKAQGLTEAQLKRDLEAQLLSEKVYEKVTSGVNVSNKQIQDYYTAHKSTYTTPKTREVAHILVKTKGTAEAIYAQLKNGADFAALAKKYSTDKQSAKNGGKLCVAHPNATSDGSCVSTVAPFDKTAFSLATGTFSSPVHSQYGWHIIKAVGPVKPAHVTALSSVRDSIRQTLLSTKKNTIMVAWVAKLKKEFASKVSYQAGYTPSTTTSAAATTG